MTEHRCQTPLQSLVPYNDLQAAAPRHTTVWQCRIPRRHFLVDAAADGRQPGLDIGGILSKAGLLASIQGQDRWDVIPELCQRLPHGLAPQSQEEIQQAVREREELMGTGLEGGVAVPHARLPGLQKPVILFGRSQHGIEWDCRDGVPVKFVFLILTSEEQTDVQIPILSAIAMAMTNDDIRTSIETTSASDLHKTLSRALRDASKKRRS